MVLTTNNVAPLREMIKQAREGGKEFIEFGEDKIRIPSTIEAEQSLSHLLGTMVPSFVPGKKIDPPGGFSEASSDQKHVLIVEENFDKLGFIRKIAPRRRAIRSLPAAVRPSLMKHQQSGLNWMQETWPSGMLARCSPTTWAWKDATSARLFGLVARGGYREPLSERP